MLTLLFLVMCPFVTHVLVDLFDLPHVLVPDSAAAVAHEHVVVDESDGIASEHMCDCASSPAADHSLVNVVIPPVVSWRTVPFADITFRRVLCVPMVKARDEVGTMHNVLGIEEPKHTLVIVGGKLDTVQALCFPPRPMFLVDLEPADPQDVHICQFSHGGMENPDLIDPKDALILLCTVGPPKAGLVHARERGGLQSCRGVVSARKI